MLLIMGGMLAAAVVFSVLLNKDPRDQGMIEFCKVECQQPPRKKKHILL